MHFKQRFKRKPSAEKFVPCLLNELQEHNYLSVCKDLQGQAKKDRNVLFKVSLFPDIKIQLKW